MILQVVMMTGLMIDRMYLFNIGLLESEGWVKVGSCILYDIFIFPHAKGTRGRGGGEWAGEGARRSWERVSHLHCLVSDHILIVLPDIALLTIFFSFSAVFC